MAINLTFSADPFEAPQAAIHDCDFLKLRVLIWNFLNPYSKKCRGISCRNFDKSNEFQNWLLRQPVRRVQPFRGAPVHLERFPGGTPHGQTRLLPQDAAGNRTHYSLQRHCLSHS